MGFLDRFKKTKKTAAPRIDFDELVLKNELPKEAVLVEDVHKFYGDHEVLKGLSFSVRRGECFGFLGKNGAGKSTFIDCLVGLKEYDAGSIKVFGLDEKEYPLEIKGQLGYVPSEPLVYDLMTGNEFIEFIASSYDMDVEGFERNFAFLKAKFDLTEEELARPVGGYSHGMKQKLRLMSSLIHNPLLWVMDEPTVGLDIMAYETLMAMMRQYVKSGKTIFLTSHNIELVAEACDRVAILKEGRIASLIDFALEPFKRKELRRIFLHIQGRGDL